MTGSIKLTPEQAAALKASREKSREERLQSIANREIRRREAEDARRYVVAYACVLCFFLGMLVGTFL